ncbi:hypothetical protein HDR67_01840, partial [bacterium]|nr:hypothetical protein [bacterium]
TSRYYPVIYFLDGQNLYKDIDSYRGVSLELENTIEKLAQEGKEAIYIGIAAASSPERREQEYSNTMLADFIIQSIHPYLSSRYRMNPYIYAFACSDACFTALALLQKELFKGVVLLSPLVNVDLLQTLTFQQNILSYISVGNQEMEGTCLKHAYAIKELLPNTNLVIDDQKEHSEQGWKSKVFDALSYLVL